MIGILTQEDLETVQQDILIVGGAAADSKQELEELSKKQEELSKKLDLLIKEVKTELDALKKPKK